MFALEHCVQPPYRYFTTGVTGRSLQLFAWPASRRQRLRWSALQRIRNSVQLTDGAVVTEAPASCTEQLARFFPHVAAQRVAVQVAALRAGSAATLEPTVMEFGDAEHGIFLSTLPLEFADRVRIEYGERTRVAEASVVAVQYHEGQKAVAVRFSRAQKHWVSQS